MNEVALPRFARAVGRHFTSVRGIARAHIQLRGTKRGARVRAFGPLLVRGRAGIEIGSCCVFVEGMLPTQLECAPGAELKIGPFTLLNYGVTIEAQRGVRIGARCMFGSLVHVRDHDGRTTAPVVIEDDVWIAHGAIVEPGSTIGAGSVVAAGAVIIGAVPPRSLATGNPAQCAPLPHQDWPEDDAALATPVRPTVVEGARHSPDVVRAAIIDWLDDTRCFGDAARILTSDATSLRDAGLVDSLGFVQLLLMLEKRFEVTIDRDFVARHDSHTVRALVDLIVRP